MKQKIFLKEYTEELRKNVKAGNIEDYQKNSFNYNNEAEFETDIERRDDLLEQMMKYATSEGDIEAAILLYESFPNLTREQACYQPFWLHLSLVDLYPYMIKRFCKDENPTVENIRNHWWHSNIMRRGLSNLWWSVHQSINPQIEDKYNYTRILFKHIDFRQRRLGSSTLFRLPEAVRGILKFLDEHVKDYFEGRANFCMMYFNNQATIRQLSILTELDFYNELVGIKNLVLSIKDRTEAAKQLQSESFSDIDSFDESWDNNSEE